MIEWRIAKRLLEAFEGSFITKHTDFVISRRQNIRFILDGCDEMETKCRLLEQVSIAGAKHQPFRTDLANRRYNDRIRAGINTFLGTQFTRGDMLVIYDQLGNGKDRAMTVRFIESGYSMAVLLRREKHGED